MRIVSFDGVGINDGLFYRSSLSAGGQVPAEATLEMVGRTGAAPVVGDVGWPERYLVIETYVPSRNVDKRSLQRDWYKLFRFGKVARLVIADDDGGRERYVMAAAFVIQHDAGGDGWSWTTMLAVDGDGDGGLAWRDVEAMEVVWDVDGDGDELVIDNGGDLEAWPVVTVEHGAPHQVYARQLALVWWSWRAAEGYPIEITNGGLDTRVGLTNFAEADGSDIHVYVDGVEVDRWVVDANTDHTRIWALLDFSPAAFAQPMADMGTDDLEALLAVPYENEGGVGGGEFGTSGILLIDSELLTYELRVGTTFFGVKRGQFGTAAASHLATAVIYGVERDVRIEYGAGAGAARAANDRRRPMFDLGSSTNTQWVYEEFREVGNPERAGSWQPITMWPQDLYAVSENGGAAPVYEVMGSRFPQTGGGKVVRESRWALLNPGGIYQVVFTNGKKYAGYKDTDWGCAVQTSFDMVAWYASDPIAAPAANQSWEGWSLTVMGGGVFGVSLYHLDAVDAARESYLECGDATVFYIGYLEFLAGPEVLLARFDVRLVNVTAGEGLGISYAVATGEGGTLVIDADRYVVRLGGAERNRLGLALPDSARSHLLRLEPGENVLRYEDAQIGEARVTVRFERRWLA